MKALMLVCFVLISFAMQAQKRVSFTLENTTNTSIPLIIPNVMNPNLSPFSESGVTLIVGQEIFYKFKGKKRLLLTVSTKEDKQLLDVAQLIKKQKVNWKKAKRKS